MIPTRRRVALPALLLAVSLAACARVPAGQATGAGGTVPAAPPQPQAPAAPTTPGEPTRTVAADPATPPKPERLTVTISGDLLWHKGLIADGAAAGKASGRDYDFVPLFEHIRPLIEGADVSICHVEVPVAPRGVKPSGYPVFAAPRETIAAAADVGFDHCTVASNHTFDQGWAGVEATLDALDEEGIVHTGAYRSQDDAAAAPATLTTESGVTVAVVAGSYTSNLAAPGGRTWALDRLDTERMIERGRAAREAGADLVIAAMHAGTEHQRRPNDQQVQVATFLARSGAFNLVYGHHAHVPQPWDTIDGVPVVYGGGNLVAQMKVATPRAYEQYLGRITFERRGERFEAVGTEYVPLLMTLSRPGNPARVLDVNLALAEGRGDAARLRVAREQVAQAVGLLGAEVTEVG